MAGLFEVLNPETVYATALYAAEMLLRVVPMLTAAVFLAEMARLWLGEDRLRMLLVGRYALAGRMRALALGALLPFCECGAFPVMLGLIRAGVPAGAVLTFFLVSPVVSMPAFMILLGVFGLPLSLLYLLITSAAALLGSFLLEPIGRRRGMFKDGVAVAEGGCASPGLSMSGGGACCEADGVSSCRAATADHEPAGFKEKVAAAAGPAWGQTRSMLRRVLPYLVLIVLISALLRGFVPEDMIRQVLSARAPFDVLIAALAGIPIYTGDCAMIALVAPLIGATGAVGAGIAFIISGSGTSINGIIFMSSVFKRQFLIFYVTIVICIALGVGYLISTLLALGLV